MPDAVAETLCNAYELGKKRHEESVCERLEKCEVPLTDTIRRVSLQTFAKRADTKSKDNNKVNALKKDVSLVSHLFLSLQSRPDFDSDAFFKYENQRESPSLSDKGKPRSGKKSAILQCLTITKVTSPDDITVTVLDAPAVVYMIRPTKATDFQQYVDHHFIPYIASAISESTSRVDIIWDTYPDHIIKAQTQSRRGTPGAPSTPIPYDRKKLLGNAENKIQLFRYLSKAIVKAEPLRNVLVYSTYDDTVLINSSDQQSTA